MADLRANFEGECSEVGMYLAMARVAHREGYPEIGLYWEKAAFEEAEHAAKFAELLGEVVTDSTEKNLQMRVDALRTVQPPASLIWQSVLRLSTLDAIHDTVHEMARDEARHGKGFRGPAEALLQQVMRPFRGQAEMPALFFQKPINSSLSAPRADRLLLYLVFTFALHGTAGAVSGTAGRMLFHRTERGKQRDADQCQNQNGGKIHIPCLLMPGQMPDRHSGRQRQ